MLLITESVYFLLLAVRWFQWNYKLALQVLGLLTGFVSIRASEDQVSCYVLTRCRVFP